MNTPPKPSLRLSLNSRQSRELVRFARMLDVSPARFLQWILNIFIDDLADPYQGRLKDCAHDLIAYDTEAEARGAQARVERWNARRRAAREIEETTRPGSPQHLIKECPEPRW